MLISCYTVHYEESESRLPINNIHLVSSSLPAALCWRTRKKYTWITELLTGQLVKCRMCDDGQKCSRLDKLS